MFNSLILAINAVTLAGVAYQHQSWPAGFVGASIAFVALSIYRERNDFVR